MHSVLYIVDTWEDHMRFGGLVKRVYLFHSKRINEKLKEYDLTMSQLDVLIHVSIANERGKLIKQRDIEKKLNLTNPTVTGIIHRLELKGLIEKQENSEDKRIKYLFVTQKAKTINDEAKNMFEQCDAIALSDFQEEEKKELEQYLLRIIENLKKGE